MVKIQKTQFKSYKIKGLAKGCKQCVKGEKLVMYITGICNRGCFYCPLSEQKSGKDVIFANEWDTGFEKGELSDEQFDIIVKESELTEAKGCGITGGDPLLVNERTCLVIKRLKEKFGDEFHIHLYTSLKNITEDKLNDLYKAGLDEIRFHPDFVNDKEWDKIDLASKFEWDIGVEIPVIPEFEKQTEKMIDFLNRKIKFLNLNELELSDTNSCHLTEHGYSAKNDLSYGVKGSEEMALRLMDYVLDKKYGFKVHYCTCALKDGVQMANRIKIRAKNVAHKFDKITKEGMLIRGVIYLEDYLPGFSYGEKMKKIGDGERKKVVEELVKIRYELVNKFSIGKNSIIIDEYKLRLLTSEKIAKKVAKKLKKGLKAAVVEEYPTHDGFEVEVRFI
jgi:uncharacterized protein